MASATKRFLANVGGGVKCFRTDHGTVFVDETFARMCSDLTIHHEHTGVDGPNYSGVVEHGLGLIQEGSMAACFEPPPSILAIASDPGRYWAEADIYINECFIIMATTANTHFKSPYFV